MMLREDCPVPVLGISAFSGTGKTTLLTQLIPALKATGLKVAVIKHAHHDVDIDKPGKDSYEIRKAGATPVILASERRTAIMFEKDKPSAPSLKELLQYIDVESVDLVLVEGFKSLEYDKLFLFRHQVKDRHQELDDDILALMSAPSTLAIVTDIDKNNLQSRLNSQKTVLDINNFEEISTFIVNLMKRDDP